jgi:hypothetical protein
MNPVGADGDRSFDHGRHGNPTSRTSGRRKADVLAELLGCA